MSAAERLAAALSGIDVEDPNADRVAADALAADPTLAQDIEDGRALRELREALAARDPLDFLTILGPNKREPDWSVSGDYQEGTGDTLAAAADACRAALEVKP